MPKSEPSRHRERHRGANVGWLRAAVLGANDGLISTASLVVGVAASGAEGQAIVIAGVAGMAAGAMSMAAGEYVSVSSQADVEAADLAVEKDEIASDPVAEQAELTQIYVQRGLTADLADRVSTQLMAHDALGAHARDELGLTELTLARPLQAAAASAASFAVGAILPVLVASLSPAALRTPLIWASTLVLLAVLGALAAGVGGASATRGAARVAFWGLLAMAVSDVVGRLFGAAI